MDFAQHTIKGRYVIEKMFGPPEDAKGGQATVYKGVDTQTGLIVAIKIFDNNMDAGVEASSFQTLGAHENIIQFIDYDPQFAGTGAMYAANPHPEIAQSFHFPAAH